MHWMILPFKRYADFSGRSQRMEYWMFTLLYIVVITVTILLAGGIEAIGSGAGIFGSVSLILLAAFFIVSLIPSIAVTVRRLHDQDKSGWWYLISFIPYLGGLVLFIFMCLDGTRGSNQYGPDPKGVDADIFT